MLIDPGQFGQYVGYVPLGVIGVWRWSVWVFKKFISFFYKDPTGKYRASVSIVTPVYNEDPVMFRMALMSWKQNNPKEIIAVIDHTDTACIETFNAFCKTFSGGKIVITEKPGKRAALGDGIRLSRGRIVALVDSDTVWTEDFLQQTLGSFEDKKVGGVAPRQDVMEVDTLAKRLFRIHIFNRYGNDLIFQTAFGDAVSCISGRTGLYRRTAIKDLVDELENEIFMGKKCISGDDKRLTNLIQREGWKVRYVRNALVYTPGFPDMRTYLKQQIRWTRNSWRSDLTSIAHKWMWKNPYLTFHTIDRFFQPFTLLLGPIFLCIAIYKGDWIFVIVLLAWWFASRSVKIFGHLRKHPRDLMIMPVYIVYTYVIAVIKIYTLFTVGEQSWITRWDKDRMQKVFLYKKWLAYGMTFCTVMALAATSVYFNIYVTGAKSFLEKSKIATEKKIKKMIKYEEESGILFLDDPQTEEKFAELYYHLTKDQFGYYQVGAFETVQDVRRRFLLAQDVPLYREDKTVIGAGDVIRLGEIIAIDAIELQKTQVDEYRQLYGNRFVVTTDYTENAIRVKGKGAFVSISDLAQRLRNVSALEQTGEKEWILRRNLFIDDGVTLIIEKEDVEKLKLYSSSDGFVWIKAENGNIVIRDTEVTSWDEKVGDVDRNYEDGRSYILQKSSGRMDIMNSEISYLGYYGYPNRGNPFGGPYGVSWKIQDGYFKKELSTGSVTNSRIHDNLFGIYTYGATGILISRNEIDHNAQYGIDPHDDSNHMMITENHVHDNGNHGIITSKRCYANMIRGNYSHDNALHGIMLDRDSNNNLVEYNYTSGNVNGIALYHSSDNIIRNNQFIDNQIGIRANNYSHGNYFEKNIIKANAKGIYFYDNASKNMIIESDFSNNALNVHFKNKSSNYYDLKDMGI